MSGAPRTAPEDSSLCHEAMFYTDDDGYVDATRAFVEAGLAAAEPVLVAVPGPNLELLKAAIGSPAGLSYRDMSEAGRNPGWIIPGVLLAFAGEHRGSRVRMVGEPIWAGRSPAAYPRCVQHEALINIALAGYQASVLCAYDAGRLDIHAIADAASTHPVLIRAGERQVSPGYGSPEAVVDAFNRPLPEPTRTPSTLLFDASGLSGMRALVAALAGGAGLVPDRVADLQVAVSEIATNAVTHGGNSAVLRAWADVDGMICEVTGSSVLTDRLAGRIPAPPLSDRGRGLLLVNYLCDLVEVHTDDRSTTVRLHVNR